MEVPLHSTQDAVSRFQRANCIAQPAICHETTAFHWTHSM